MKKMAVLLTITIALLCVHPCASSAQWVPVDVEKLVEQMDALKTLQRLKMFSGDLLWC